MHSNRKKILDGKDVPLTKFRHFRQLVGQYCRQDGGPSQIDVSGRFLPTTIAPCKTKRFPTWDFSRPVAVTEVVRGWLCDVDDDLLCLAGLGVDDYLGDVLELEGGAPIRAQNSVTI